MFCSFWINLVISLVTKYKQIQDTLHYIQRTFVKHSTYPIINFLLSHNQHGLKDLQKETEFNSLTLTDTNSTP